MDDDAPADAAADDSPTQDPRVPRRAQLLDEELEAGSDDPTAQARVILEESDERTLGRGESSGGSVEQRASEDTLDVRDPLPDYSRRSSRPSA